MIGGVLMKFLKGVGWIFIPYITIFFQWKRIGTIGKTLGVIWGMISLAAALSNTMKGDTNSSVKVSQTNTGVQKSIKTPETENSIASVKKKVNAKTSISEQDYDTYYNGLWLWRIEFNNTAESAIGLYDNYKNGSKTLDELHKVMFNAVEQIENIKSTFDQTVPKGYKDFDQKAKKLNGEELNVLVDFEVTNGDELDADISKIKTLIMQFNDLKKSFPKPKIISSN